MKFNKASEGKIEIITDDSDLAYLEPRNKDNCGYSTNIEGEYLYPIEYLEEALRAPVEGTFSQMAYNQIRSLSNDEITEVILGWKEATRANDEKTEEFRNLIKKVRTCG